MRASRAEKMHRIRGFSRTLYDTFRKGREMNEYSEIMAAIVPTLQANIGAAPAIFKLWFDGFDLYELTDTKAIFTTVNQVKKKVLLNKYIAAIRSAVEESLGFPLTIEIYTRDEVKGGVPETVEVAPEAPDIPVPTEEDREDILPDVVTGMSDKKFPFDTYTFENFVEGSSNRFARAACEAVAKEPTYYNPLFIYGNSGLGKTHLLWAIINYMRRYHPTLKIVYKKCEKFLEEMIEAIQTGDIAPFKERYRKCDVLLIDDIQFLAGKEATQEEFFHTFSTLYEANKQIIMTSDRPPKDIKPLSDRLRTRFEGGLLADVQPPSYELRIAIINKKAASIGLSISNELIEYMAERLQNNIRQIEGALKRLHALTSFTSSEITKERIDEVISIVDPGNIPTDAMVERILVAVSKHYGITVEDIKSKKRTANIAKARHVSIYLIKNNTELTLQGIGAIFDGRNHSTISSSLDQVEIMIRTVNGFERELKKIIREITS